MAEMNGHTEPVRIPDARMAVIERRLTTVAESSETRVAVLRDAIADFVAVELAQRDEEIALLREQVADLQQKLEQQAAIDRRVNEISTRLEEKRARRDRGKNGISDGDFMQMVIAQERESRVTPNVCGTYDVREKYERLDVVAFDGTSFIACKDDPGICPGPDWQPLSRPGKPGRSGESITGPRGEKGEKGEPGPSIVSWQIDRERYRASPLMSNGTVGPMLELRELFEQFLLEIS